jgi:hypothetical protein
VVSKPQNREEEHMPHQSMKVLGMARLECCFLSCRYKKKIKKKSKKKKINLFYSAAKH